MPARQNILLLSAGRRVELLRAFKRELALRESSASVFATDLKPSLAAACKVADNAFAMPRVTEAGYTEKLLELCLRENVGLVVPTIDTELLGLAQARSTFASHGINVVISDERVIRSCRDKRLTSDLFKALDISSPRIMERHMLTFPCFAKPYDGSRSIGAVKLAQASDLTNAMQSDLKLMFMEYIDSSHEEYTVDAYYDRNGMLQCMVPRHRLEVRDGEISKGITRRNEVYDYLLPRLSRLKGARGCLTIQLFAKPDTHSFAASEINPRFGGGFPLSYAAGADFPGWLIDEYLYGKSIAFCESWESDLLMLRYDEQVIVRNAF